GRAPRQRCSARAWPTSRRKPTRRLRAGVPGAAAPPQAAGGRRPRASILLRFGSVAAAVAVALALVSAAITPAPVSATVALRTRRRPGRRRRRRLLRLTGRKPVLALAGVPESLSVARWVRNRRRYVRL